MISTDPARGATGVPVNKKITATFATAMDPAAFTTKTFTVKQGTAPVAGAVSYSGNTAIFSPTDALEPGTVYTATIAAGVKGAKAAPEISKCAECTGLWLTALAGVAVAGALVAGNTDQAPPETPKLPSDYVWSFTTDAGTEPPDTVRPTVSSVLPANGATGVPIGGNLAATFSEAMNPSTINGETCRLYRGETAVPGVASCNGRTVTFDPTGDLLYNTDYTWTITTGVTDLHGNALLRNFVAQFSTGAAPALSVIDTIPAFEASGASPCNSVAVRFNQVVEPATITTDTFTVSDGETVVPGLVTAEGDTATFTPEGGFSLNTTYTAVITTGAMGLYENALASNHEWTFTTGEGDVTAPAVVSTNPADGSTDVPIGGNITVAFDEAMRTSTIIFTLLDDAGVPVGCAMGYSGAAAAFTPAAALAPNTTYTATIAAGAADLCGNPLGGEYTWRFTTAESPALAVVSTVPVGGTAGAAIGTNITAAFNQAMDPATFGAGTFTLSSGGAEVAGAVSCAGETATFNPASDLAYDTTYTATITTGVAGLSGLHLASNYAWNFTTGAAPAPAPICSPVDPGAIDVRISFHPRATFNQAMDPATINAGTFTLTQGGTPVSGTVTYDADTRTARFNPTVYLAPNTVYTATMTAGATAAAGTPLASNAVWTFTTGAQEKRGSGQ